MSNNPGQITSPGSDTRNPGSDDQPSAKNTSSSSSQEKVDSSCRPSKPETKSRLYQATAASQAKGKAAGATTNIKKPLLPKQATAVKPTTTTARKGPLKPSQDVAGASAEAGWKKSGNIAATAKRGKATPDKKPPPRSGQSSSTPTNSTMVAKRVVSTPTSDTDVTLGSWDASAIHQVNTTQASGLMMDETLTAEPVLKSTGILGKGADVTVVKTKGTKPTKGEAGKPKKPNLASVSQTAVKPKQKLGTSKGPAATGCGEESEDNYVTDEQLNYAYTRYIQAKFIEMKSREAVARCKEENEKQLFRAWSGVEDLRMKYNKQMEELAVWKTLDRIQQSLKVVRSSLQPVLEVMEGFQNNFAMVSTELDSVRHNLAVQGIRIEDQKTAREELDKLTELFKEFNKETDSIDSVVDEDSARIQAMAAEYEKLAQNFSQALKLSEDCTMLLTTLKKESMREASLRTSLMQLEKAEREEAEKTN